MYHSGPGPHADDGAVVGAGATGAGRRARRRLTATLAAVGITAAGLGGGLAAGLTAGTASTAGATGGSRPQGSPGARLTAASGSAAIDVAAVAAKVDPAVVNINTTLDPLEGGGKAAGTGMILTANGLVVTNNHVVQGATNVEVTIAHHGTHPAVVIGTVPTKDVALLKVRGFSHLPTVHFANSATAVVGTPVVAIGNALGLGGSPTVTAGAITARGRTITAADATGANRETLHGLLQTDAEIVPGNSGGPLVNAGARVVGMDTAAASAGTASTSVGFAIPSNAVRTLADELAAHKRLTGFVYGRQAFLGVEVVDSSQISGSSPFGTSGNPFGFGFGFGPVATTPNGTPGVVVAAVDRGSGAAKAGLVSGDVITSAGGRATPTTAALSKAISAHKPGQVIPLTVSTLSGTGTVRVHLGKAPID